MSIATMKAEATQGGGAQGYAIGPPELRHWLGAQLNTALKSRGGFGSMSLLCPRKEVADDAAKVLVRDLRGRPVAVLLCSQPDYPDHVARDTEAACAARRVLGPKLSRVIPTSLLRGEIQGVSFAVLPWLQEMSTSRWQHRLQRAILSHVLAKWLRRATTVTVHAPEPAEVKAAFLQPLTHLLDHRTVANEIRCAARGILERLRDGAWEPKHVLDHNDLYLGNVLLSPRGMGRIGLTGRFFIIDWGGSNCHGYLDFGTFE